MKTFLAMIAIACASAIGAQKPAKPKAAPKPTAKPARTFDDDGIGDTAKATGAQASLDATELAEFEKLTPSVQKFIKGALHLTKCRLSYQFGSCEPEKGGMDCSGTIHFLLRYMGLKNPPRDSSAIYLWAEAHGTLRAVRTSEMSDPLLRDLRPGDLLFWEGTYDVKRNPPISHTMIYLGREKKTGTPVMAGSSDGRSYRGVKRNGVSVFDFKLPKAGSKSVFVGYARVPGL